MFRSNSLTKENPESIQQPPDEKKSTTLEIEMGSKNDDDDLNHLISECKGRVYNWSEFLELTQRINSNDQLKRYSGLNGIRKLLNESPPDEGQVQKVLDAGLLSKLIDFMLKDDEPVLQLEATWALVGITAGTSDQVKEVVDQGAVPILVQMLKSCHTQLVEHAVWAITNIGVEPEYRDTVLDHEALHPLVAVLEKALEKKDETVIGPTTRTLSALCRTKPLPDYERVADATPILCTVIQEVNNVDILEDALWALNCLSNTEEKISRVLEADVVPSLIRRLNSSDEVLTLPVLRILGNIISGSDEQAGRVLKGPFARNYVKKLFKLLEQRDDHEDLRQEICWTLSNITGGSSDSLDLILDNSGYIKQLVDLALYDILEVKIHALWALKNATVHANPKQMISMTRSGVFGCACKLIHQDFQGSQVLPLGLRAIQNFLAFGASMAQKKATNNQYLIRLKQTDAINKIKKFRGSREHEVPELALEIWKKYLKGNLLRKKLRLKRAIMCFRNERHSLFGLFQNKKKRLTV